MGECVHREHNSRYQRVASPCGLRRALCAATALCAASVACRTTPSPHLCITIAMSDTATFETVVTDTGTCLNDPLLYPWWRVLEGVALLCHS